MPQVQLWGFNLAWTGLEVFLITTETQVTPSISISTFGCKRNITVDLTRIKKQWRRDTLSAHSKTIHQISLWNLHKILVYHNLSYNTCYTYAFWTNFLSIFVFITFITSFSGPQIYIWNMRVGQGYEHNIYIFLHHRWIAIIFKHDKASFYTNGARWLVNTCHVPGLV